MLYEMLSASAFQDEGTSGPAAVIARGARWNALRDRRLHIRRSGPLRNGTQSDKLRDIGEARIVLDNCRGRRRRRNPQCGCIDPALAASYRRRLTRDCTATLCPAALAQTAPRMASIAFPYDRPVFSRGIDATGAPRDGAVGVFEVRRSISVPCRS